MARERLQPSPDRRSGLPPGRTAILATVAAALILYGSLYPFQFRSLPSQTGLLDTLLQTWNQPIGGRGDFAANLVLYAPLGFFAGACLVAALTRAGGLILATLIGLLLSCSVEIAQLFIPGRTSSIWDVYLNAGGCFIGALAAAAGGADLVSSGLGLRERRVEPFAIMLVLCWLGYRLYPYVPTIGLHKYWSSLKPLVLTPTFEPFRSLRLAVLWLVAAHLIEIGTGRFRPFLLVPAVLVGTLLCGIVIVDKVVTLAEVLAIGAALLGWVTLRRSSWNPSILLVLLCVVIVADRLAPFDFSEIGRPFGWIPFRGVFGGHWGRGLQALLEKSFLYGSLLWLLVRSGAPLGLAAGAGMLLLLVTSLLQTRLPDRSGEITDTVLVGGMAVVFALLRQRKDDRSVTAPGKSARRPSEAGTGEGASARTSTGLPTRRRHGAEI